MRSVLEIAEKCEKATGPDREIDCEIAVALFGGEIIWKQSVGTMEAYPVRRYASQDHVGGFCNGFVPAYTASLDAARGLVRPRWYSVYESQNFAKANVGWALTNDGAPGTGKSAPLALCAAFLRALAQENPDGR